MPGSVFPSRNSSDAPPPVDMCVKCCIRFSVCIASTVDPPPANVKASVFRAIACATSTVPALNDFHSKSPTGPFHMILRA